MANTGGARNILAETELQIAYSTTDLLILGIAGGLPECPSCLVLEGDQRSYPTGAAAAEVLLTGPSQCDPNALPPTSVANSEPVHIPSPAVPTGDQGTDDLAIALGNQKGGGGISNQAFDIIQAIGRTRVLTPRLSPKPQDRSRVLTLAPTYRDSLASQVPSMAKASWVLSSKVRCPGQRP